MITDEYNINLENRTSTREKDGCARAGPKTFGNGRNAVAAAARGRDERVCLCHVDIICGWTED